MREIYQFLKNPYSIYIPPRNSNPYQISKEIIRFLFIYLGLTIAIGIFLNFIDGKIQAIAEFSIQEQSNLNFQHIKSKCPQSLLFVRMALFAPFIEELIFRLPLNLTLRNIAIALGAALLLGLPPSRCFYFHSGYQVISYVMVIACIVTIYFKLPNKPITHIGKNLFNINCYVWLISFGLLHIINYRPLHLQWLFIYPLFILPQLCAGFILGYFRIKYHSILPGMILHFIINALSIMARV